MTAGRALNEMDAARLAVRGSGRGRRIAMQQMNHAYVVLLLSQFQRFCRELGVKLWRELRQSGMGGQTHHRALETLNHWRNAIAHQDFRNPELRGRTTIRRTEIRRWRTACNRLAVDMDMIMHAYLTRITGAPPW
jgi:hypothetical protein